MELYGADNRRIGEERPGGVVLREEGNVGVREVPGVSDGEHVRKWNSLVVPTGTDYGYRNVPGVEIEEKSCVGGSCRAPLVGTAP